jgi:hypothetical protein
VEGGNLIQWYGKPIWENKYEPDCLEGDWTLSPSGEKAHIDVFQLGPETALRLSVGTSKSTFGAWKGHTQLEVTNWKVTGKVLYGAAQGRSIKWSDGTIWNR